jgi:predicted ATPase/DNA-binding SARP family transcriptional activator
VALGRLWRVDEARSTAAAPLVQVLGPVRVRGVDGDLREPSGALPKRLLVALALAGQTGSTVDGLTDAVWQDDPPRNPKAALQMLVSRVRAGAADGVVESTPTGYACRNTDLTTARDRLIVAETAAPDAAGPAAEAALRILAGTAAADLETADVVDDLRAEVARLTERAHRARLRASAGDATAELDDLDWLAAAHPYDASVQAARMRALQQAGRSADAVASFAAHRDRLAEDLGADPSDELVALNAELLRGTTTTRHETVGLRIPATSLLGRIDDLERLEHLVLTGRLTTVLGAGGLGKTRVATELGLRVRHRVEFQRIVFVELAGATSGDDVVPVIAAALRGRTAAPRRIGDAMPPTPTESRLRETLAERPTLLILDNCEHVIDAVAAEVDDLLGSVATTTVLTTSRVPLGIGAERVYALPPLSAQTDAAALFAERAQAARPGVLLDPVLLESVCTRLDGLPLAIELAAARVRSMSLDDLARRLDDRFAVLVGSDRSAPERHRTLLAVIDWSWRLLAAAEQHALRRLSVFPDGFTAEAATVALGTDATDLLDELVQHSLLTVLEPDSGRTRYRMLETVRDFGMRALHDAGETTAAIAAMDDWIVTFCRSRQTAPVRLIELRIVRDEVDTLLASLRRPPGGREHVVLETYGLLAGYWSFRDQHGSVIEHADVALDAWRRRSPHAGPTLDAAVAGFTMLAITSGFSRAQQGPRASGILRTALARQGVDDANFWNIFGRLALLALRSDPMTTTLLDTAARSPDAVIATTALTVRSSLSENAGRIDAAIRDLDRGLKLAIDADLDWHRGTIEASMAQLLSQRGERAAAVDWASRSRERLTESNSDVRQLDWIIGTNEVGNGDLEAAEGRFTALLDAGLAAADRADGEPANPVDMFDDMRSVALLGLAEVATARGDAESAERLWTEAVAVASQYSRAHPWALLSASGSLAATVRLHPEPSDAVVERATAALRRLRPRVLAARRVLGESLDVPALAGAVLGIAAFLLWPGRSAATDEQRRAGAELAGLAVALGGRRDVPSLRVATDLAEATNSTVYDEARATASGPDVVARVIGLLQSQALRM